MWWCDRARLFGCGCLTVVLIAIAIRQRHHSHSHRRRTLYRRDRLYLDSSHSPEATKQQQIHQLLRPSFISVVLDRHRIKESLKGTKRRLGTTRPRHAPTSHSHSHTHTLAHSLAHGLVSFLPTPALLDRPTFSHLAPCIHACTPRHTTISPIHPSVVAFLRGLSHPHPGRPSSDWLGLWL